MLRTVPYTAIVSLLFFIGCQHRANSEDSSVESVTGMGKEFYISCVGFEKEFSLTISGCGTSRIPQKGKINWKSDNGRFEDPVLKVDPQPIDGVAQDLVIGVSGKRFEVDFPKRWCGKSNSRLEKTDPKFGYEVKEMVGFIDKNRLLQMQTGPIVVLVQTSSSKKTHNHFDFFSL